MSDRMEVSILVVVDIITDTAGMCLDSLGRGGPLEWRGDRAPLRER